MRTLLALLLAIPLAWGVPAPADALSCVAPADVVSESRVVFQGRIVDSDRRRILIEVDEVWRGDDVVRRQWLRVDMIEWTSWSDGRQHLRKHVTEPSPWVFAPRHGVVNPCTMWPANTTGLGQFRPARPAQPRDGWMRESDEGAEARPGSGLPFVPLAGVGIALVLGLTAWRLRSSRVSD